MIIKGESKYIPQLTKLWQDVFGDNKEYIKIFFDRLYCETECFIKIADGEIISAFYLLKGQIKYNNEVFDGRYLYAAATKNSHRKQGLMAELINEAVDYAKKESLDFICLLPANEGLYNYYSKFGFKDAMYKYRTVSGTENQHNSLSFETDKSLHKARKIIDENMFFFSQRGNDYALECLRFVGYNLYNLSNEVGFDFFIVAGIELKEIVEVICKKENYIKAEEYLEKFFSSDTEISSPFKGEKGEKIRFGMLYVINEKLNGAEIYMNIALD